jgi:hypothetical protein
MSEQQLHGSQVLRASMDQRSLRSPHRVRPICGRIEPDLLDPTANNARTAVSTSGSNYGAGYGKGSHPLSSPHAAVHGRAVSDPKQSPAFSDNGHSRFKRRKLNPAIARLPRVIDGKVRADAREWLHVLIARTSISSHPRNCRAVGMPYSWAVRAHTRRRAVPRQDESRQPHLVRRPGTHGT